MRRKGFLKKVLSLILVIGLMLPMLPTDIFAASSKTIKLHYWNSLKWSKVNVYAWNEDVSNLGSWPGTTLSQGTDGYYTYTINDYEQSYINFIFNNGSSQTADLYADVSKTTEWWVYPAKQTM